MTPFQDLKKGDTVGGFLCEEVREIKERNMAAYIFTHEKTKAKCVHLFTEDKNNLFSIGFRTPVFDHTGVPHILEHSVLAGSKKYPLKDPFKEMLKSSMHTFLNAMTYPDRTIYPISSQVKADFFNLSDVYCDAVFNPILNRYTFAQEGWHFDADEKNGEVSIKGIVYNEMKGVFSDFGSFVERNLYSSLFPDTTYFYESGGNPENIPELTYEKFMDFHRKFYHPSNSFIVLYGNIPSCESLVRLNDNYLKNFDEQKIESRVSPQKTFDKPAKTHVYAPAPKEDDGKATVLLAWNWRDKKDNESNMLELRILSDYLLSGEAAPLKNALLDSGLGEDLDDLSGTETDLYAVSFVAGLKKTKPEYAEKIASLIKDTIKKEVQAGFDGETVEGILRRLEFKAREVGGDSSYPLKFATRVYKFWIYGCDPVKFLQFEEQFAAIRKNIAENERYLENLLENLTLKNPNELLLTVQGSSEIGEKLGKLSEEQAKKLSANFSESDLKKYAKFAEELADYQQREHTPQELNCIPMLKKSDIPTKSEGVLTVESEICGAKRLHSPIFTGGVFYLNLAFDFSVIPNDLLEYVGLYTEYIARCGAGGLTAAQTTKEWKLQTGGFSAFSIMGMNFKKAHEFVSQNVFSVKTLEKNVPQTLDLLMKLLLQTDFDDKNLMKNVLNEVKNDAFEDIIQQGHSHAIIDASARISPANVMKYRMDGVGYYRFLKNLRETETEILAKLQKIHVSLINSRKLTVSTSFDAGKEKSESEINARLKDFVAKIPSFESKIELTTENLRIEPISEINAVEISSSVNYCANAFAVKEESHKFIGETMLLSQVLAKGYLWDKIRVEGGAYGGFCSFSHVGKIFSFGSFRDPNVSKTFGHFIDSLTKNKISQEILDRAVPSQIAHLDLPRSPSVKTVHALRDFFSQYSNEDEQKIRDAILSADEKSVSQNIQIMAQYAQNGQKSVIGSKEAIDLAQNEGLKFKRSKL